MGRPRIHSAVCSDCGAPTRADRCRSCYLALMAATRTACQDCGKTLPRCSKATLCRACWLKPALGDGHGRARRRYPLDGRECEYDGCSESAVDRHHVNGNTLDNERENIAFYCRRHHMAIDGRLDRFAGASGGRGRGSGPVPRDDQGRFAVGRLGG